MSIIQIEITDGQRKALDSLAKDTGKSPQEIVRKALDDLLCDQDPVDWKAAIARGAGLWANRDDLPDFEQIRREWDREPWGKQE